MLSQDMFRQVPRRFAGFDFYGRPAPIATETKLPETSWERTEAIKTAAYLARKAGLSDAAIADALKQAGATVEEIKAYVTTVLTTKETGTATTTATVPAGDPVRTPPPASSISPTTIGIGLFVAWLIFK